MTNTFDQPRLSWPDSLELPGGLRCITQRAHPPILNMIFFFFFFGGGGGGPLVVHSAQSSRVNLDMVHSALTLLPGCTFESTEHPNAVLKPFPRNIKTGRLATGHFPLSGLGFRV